ncbi:MAG TPA: DEAD/DEAH box helicase [Thermoanaerobaculia bacterium]|nr:DEAD/DEAH box helicase [Thermoanaerobaculia bacterium]
MPARFGDAAPAAPGSALDPLVAVLREDARLGPEIVHALRLPPVPARGGTLDPPLPPALAEALAARGVSGLWSHQTEALRAARAGRDVLVTTPTASGKSLVFQLPVLEEALAGRPGRALWLFPLKALGQDQLGKLVELAASLGLDVPAAGDEAAGDEAAAPLAAIYDGDTPRAERARLRAAPPRVLITNPDMLHLGVLAHWVAWEPFLRELRWIVIDELHTYRGLFGSHFHHVLHRLLRLAGRLGARPALVAASATAGNAGEFARTLAGRDFAWVEESGAPREGRHLLLMRPASSPYSTTLDLFVRLLRAGLKTIVFTKARRITELLFSWLRSREPELARRVRSYRSGFLPEERREIEADLFAGRIDGVISTSALEMGIDVGGLDACILVGYPGSVMATWQRSGRVGRSGRESLTALVALPDALDQWFLDHPQQLVRRPCERLIANPGSPAVARAHLLCAAAESPLVEPEDAGYLERHRERVDELLASGRLLESADGEALYSLSHRPHRDVALRGTGATFRIVHGRRTVGTIDSVRVLHECHPGAVYLHGGRQYLVAELDLERHQVVVERVDLDYFTQPLTEKQTEILEVLEERRPASAPGAPPLQAWLGRVRVTERVVGYERRRLQGRDALSRHELDLPPVRYETEALWWAAPRAAEETLRRRGAHFMGALHAAEHAAISLFPLLALCDRGDLGGISFPFHPQVGCGAVFVYDGHEGGAGIAAAGFADLEALLGRVAELVAGCPCGDGCPSCIQSPKCGNGNRPLDKDGAVAVLRLLLGRDAPEVPWGEAVELCLELPGGDDGEQDGAEAAGASADAAGGCGVAAESSRAARASGNGHGGGNGHAAAILGAAGDTVLFDLETLRSAAEVGGWGNAHRMGVAVAVVCRLEEGCFEVYTERRVGELAAALSAARLVVGFNVKRFDYRVLAGYTGVDYARKLPTLDLLEELHGALGFRLGLGHLALETLGIGKSADGLQSLAWVREGRLDLVEDYCRRDVEVLRDLYLHGRREGCVFYRDRKRDARLRVRVAW